MVNLNSDITSIIEILEKVGKKELKKKKDLLWTTLFINDNIDILNYGDGKQVLSLTYVHNKDYMDKGQATIDIGDWCDPLIRLNLMNMENLLSELELNQNEHIISNILLQLKEKKYTVESK